MADYHEMRMVAGQIRAVYYDAEQDREYVVVDGERIYLDDSEIEEDAEYEVGGICVRMSEQQAARWNAGEWDNEHDPQIVIVLPDRYEVLPSGNSGRLLEFSREISYADVSAEIAAQMDGMPANRVR